MRKYRKIIELLRLLPLFLLLHGCGPDKQTQPGDTSTKQEEETSTSWLKEFYMKAIDTTLFNTESFNIIFYKELTDTSSYCLIEISDQLCSTTFLATQVNRRNRQISQVEERCDGDYSNPVYTFSTYRLDSTTNTIQTTEVNETANKEYLVTEEEEKRFREGYDMQNAKTSSDSIVMIRKVLPDGRISERQQE